MGSDSDCDFVSPPSFSNKSDVGASAATGIQSADPM
jgi:hypothetical protein